MKQFAWRMMPLVLSLVVVPTLATASQTDTDTPQAQERRELPQNIPPTRQQRDQRSMSNELRGDNSQAHPGSSDTGPGEREATPQPDSRHHDNTGHADGGLEDWVRQQDADQHDSNGQADHDGDQ